MSSSGAAMGEGKALSPWLALVTILKGMIGAGILSLPYVFGKVRLALAVPGYLIVTAICAFSVWRLIQCKALLLRPGKQEQAAGAGSTAMGSQELILNSDHSDEEDEEDASSSCSSCAKLSPRSRTDEDWGLGPLALVGSRMLGPLGLVLAGFGVLVSQLGFCVAYIEVIVETLRGPQLLGPETSALWLRLGVLVALCALCLIRRLEHIAKLSGIALFIYCYLFWALIWWGSQEVLHGSEPRTASAWTPIQWSEAGLWFGTAIFAQEAIVISQYVYDEMHLDDPMDFLPVLIGSFSLCGILSVFVGGFGYWCYGDGIKDVFYLSFPSGVADVAIAEAILCLVLLASFVLQLYPVVSFVEALATRTRWSATFEAVVGRDLLTLPMRWALVALASLAAASIPNLPCVSGYSGSFAMSTIGFFLPPLCHIKAHNFKLSALDWAGDGLLLLAGCAAVLFGVLSTSC